MAAFDASKPCTRKVRRPLTQPELAEAEQLRSHLAMSTTAGRRQPPRYAKPTRDRQQAAQ